jgi:hypothetical protein
VHVGSVACDSFTGQAYGREVTVGDALDMLTLGDVRAAIRGAIGYPAQQLGHTCDVIVDEVCRQWPERHMANLARKLDCDSAGGQVFDAIAVITAKVREQIEARWDCKHSEQAALDLVLRAIVVEFANLWFFDAAARIGLRKIIFTVRQRPTA